MNVVRKISALDARRKLGQLLKEVYYKGDQYLIERAGRPMAAVVLIWQIEGRGKRQKRIFGMVREVWKRNKRVKAQVIEKEVDEAVQAVRAKAKKQKA